MSTFSQAFLPMTIEGIGELARNKHDQGWRYVQILAVNTEEGVDVIYSFYKDGMLENYKVEAVQKADHLPSISHLFLEAFVCENEIHDLYDVAIDNIAIDFEGNFYQLSQKAPMTVISPEQLAAREKAKKIAAAKAAKEAAAQAKKDEAQADSEKAKADAEALEAKLAGMDPEKAAKVRAAMEAKAKKEAAKAADDAVAAGEQKLVAQEAKEAALEAKLAGMDPEKAAKVRAAMEAKAKKEAMKNQEGEGE